MLERLMGPPMAAPETAGMRRLRFAVIALASATALGIVALGLIVHLVGRVAAGGLLAALITTSAFIALVYFIRKARIDDCWLLDRGFDREGQGS